MNKFKNKQTGEIVEVKKEVIPIPTMINFVYKDGEHMQTIAEPSFKEEYEEITQ